MLTIIFTSSWNHQLNICSRQEKQKLEYIGYWKGVSILRE
jgi:hypothetical protein